MRYIFYKDPSGNFGDDLNEWLWPLFFGQASECEDNKVFYGIGTILTKATILVDSNISKVVFGAGIRPSFDPIVINDSWDIKFVRGPLSSMALGGDVEFITDAAYAVRQLDTFEQLKNSPKKYEVSIMPHISSSNRLNWRSICKKLDLHYISPHSEDGVENTIKEIAASRYLISEAMHGAIIADVLRVPWKRFILFNQTGEGNVVSEFKWMDWLFSLKMPPTKSIHINILRATFMYNFIKKLSLGFIHVNFYSKLKVQNDLIQELSNINTNNFYLSNEDILNEIDRKIKEKVNGLKNEFYQLNGNK